MTQTEHVIDRYRREAHEAYEKRRAWEADARQQYHAVKADRPKELLRTFVIDEYEDTRRDRWQSIRRIAGLSANVREYVGAILETDTCTQQYEHMLWQVVAVTEENGLAMVRLAKSHYAGD